MYDEEPLYVSASELTGTMLAQIATTNSIATIRLIFRFIAEMPPYKNFYSFTFAHCKHLKYNPTL